MKLTQIEANRNIINPDAFALTKDSLVNKVTDESIKNIIFNIVSEIYNKSSTEILIRTRVREIIEPRQLIQYLLKKYTTFSFAKIGLITGGYDHATIINSFKIWSNLIDTSAPHRDKIRHFSVEYHNKIAEAKKDLMVDKTNKKHSVKQKTIRNWERFKHEYI